MKRNLYNYNMKVYYEKEKEQQKILEQYSKFELIQSQVENKKSMYNLGVLYEDRALYTKAKEWYKKASELGDEEAMNKYNELKDKY